MGVEGKNEPSHARCSSGVVSFNPLNMQSRKALLFHFADGKVRLREARNLTEVTQLTAYKQWSRESGVGYSGLYSFPLVSCLFSPQDCEPLKSNLSLVFGAFMVA